MAKPTAPLLSFGAAGQIGKTMVYAKWRGRSYVRQYVTPFNPQTTAQNGVRNPFKFLQQVYKLMPTIARAPWDAYASGKAFIGRNAFTKFNLQPLQAATTLANLIFSPGALGGLPPVSMVGTPGSGQISIAITVPSVLPTGWTITSAQAGAIKDEDPHAPTVWNITAGEDLTAPYTVVLTGLAAGATRFGAWLKWARPDGSIAYSPSIQGVATVT